jgi:hypothetical protein
VKVNEGSIDRLVRLLAAGVLIGIGLGVVRGPGGSWGDPAAHRSDGVLPSLHGLRNRHKPPQFIIAGVAACAWGAGEGAS